MHSSPIAAKQEALNLSSSNFTPSFYLVPKAVSKFENEGNGEGEGQPEINQKEAEQHHDIRGLRSTDNETGKHSVTNWTAAVQEAIEDMNYDEPTDYAHIHEENATVENIIHDKGITIVGTEKCLEPKGKGKLKEVMLQEELETPWCPSPANPDQHFDPATYEARDFYVADGSGSKRRVPDSDIIRWSKVPKPDGTTSVESNAQFVKLSDGSLQLSIGDEASEVPEGSKNPPAHVLLEMAEVFRDAVEKNFVVLEDEIEYLKSKSNLSSDDSSDDEYYHYGPQEDDATLQSPQNIVEETAAENGVMNAGEEPKDILEAGTSMDKATHEHEHSGEEIEGTISDVEEQEMEEAQENEPHDNSK